MTKQENKFKIINAGESSTETFIKCLIYGDSGVGKSYLGVTSPDCLVLLTEMNGQASIMHSNPSADIIHISNDLLLAEVLKDIEESPDNWTQYETIVIDSLSEMQRLIKDRITKNGREKMKLQDWGTLADNMRALIRRIRSLKKNVVCLALQEAQIDEESGARFIRPSFEGKKTSAEIAQFFNFVGCFYPVTEQIENDGEIQSTIVRHLMVEGPSRIMCKPVFPLTGTIRNPNLTEIFNQVQGPKPKKKTRKKKKSKAKSISVQEVNTLDSELEERAIELEEIEKEWNEDRKRFCASVKDFGGYDKVSEWSMEIGLGSPKEWTSERRLNFLNLLKDGIISVGQSNKVVREAVEKWKEDKKNNAPVD